MDAPTEATVARTSVVLSPAMGTSAVAVFAKSDVVIPLVTGVPNKLPTLAPVCCNIDPAPEIPVVPAAIDCLALSAMLAN